MLTMRKNTFNEFETDIAVLYNLLDNRESNVGKSNCLKCMRLTCICMLHNCMLIVQVEVNLVHRKIPV